MSSYEFPDYAPKWKDEIDGDDELGWFWDESKADLEKPNQIMDAEKGVEWRHIVSAMRGLVAKYQYSGPFSDKQVSDAITEVIVDETLASLVAKGLITFEDEDSYKLTELGKQVAEELSKE